MNGWLVFLVALIILVVVITIATRLLERRKMNKRTVETMGDKMFDEIERERGVEIEKAKKFRQILIEKQKGSK